MANNGVGMGSGYNNPFVWADRLNNQASAYQYDPNAYIDPGQIAQQSMMLNQQMQRQLFNQNDPKAALPQNAGSFLSQAVQKAGGFGQYGAQPAQQPQQQDPAQLIQTMLASETQRNIQDQVQNGEDPDWGKAQYMAATKLGSNPQIASLPGAMDMLSRFVDNSKTKGYTPMSAEAESANEAVKKEQGAEASVKLADLKAKAVYQIVDRGQGSDGLPTYTPIGSTVSKFGADGNIDPDYPAKIEAQRQAAAAQGAKNPTVMSIGDIDNNKFLLEKLRADRQAANQAAAAKDRQSAIDDVDQDLAAKDGHSLVLGNMTRSDFGTGAAGAAKFAAARKYAYAEDPDWSETDNDVRKANLKAWQSGTQSQNMQKGMTSVKHLEDIRKFATALGNGDNATANQARQAIQTWTGKPVPLQFQEAKSIFADELIASIKQRGGSDEDTARITSAMPNWASPKALTGVLDQEESQWADRMDSAKSSYETAVRGKHFVGDEISDPATIKVYTKHYPVDLGTTVADKARYDKLPNGAWFTQNGHTLQKTGG